MNAVVIKLDPPTDAEARELCKMGRGTDCCRYLTVGPKGWSCAKLTGLRHYIDGRAEAQTMTARGDNCLGKGD